MIFELKEDSDYVPELCYGCVGEELKCFIPDDCQWKQISYGQGEGQVLIDNCVWGFYYTDNESISVVLHKGIINLDTACDFINKVKLKVYGDKCLSVQTVLVGDDD